MPKNTINESVEGFNRYWVVDFNDLKTAGYLSTIGAANQKVIGKIAPGDIITRAGVFVIQAAAGATNLTLDLGTTSSDPDEFIDNVDVDALTKASFNNGDAFIGTDSGSATTANVINGVINNTASTVDLLMEFNGTHSSLTAGKWVIAWHQVSFPSQNG